MSYSATLWPPLQIPPVASKWLTGPIVTIRSAPPTQLPQITPYNQNWTAAPPPVDNTRPIEPNYQVTQRQINNYFGIISSNPGTNNPVNNIVPGGDIPS